MSTQEKFVDYDHKDFRFLRNKKRNGKPLTPSEKARYSMYVQLRKQIRAAFPYSQSAYDALIARGDDIQPDIDVVLFGYYTNQRRHDIRAGRELARPQKKHHTVTEYHLMLAELERANPADFNIPSTATHKEKARIRRNLGRRKGPTDGTNQGHNSGEVGDE